MADARAHVDKPEPRWAGPSRNIMQQGQQRFYNANRRLGIHPLGFAVIRAGRIVRPIELVRTINEM